MIYVCDGMTATRRYLRWQKAGSAEVEGAADGTMSGLGGQYPIMSTASRSGEGLHL